MGKKTLDEARAVSPVPRQSGIRSRTRRTRRRRAFVRRLIQALESRIKLASDILLYDEFFVADEAMTYDEKAFGKRIKDAPESIELLRSFRGETRTGAGLHRRGARPSPARLARSPRCPGRPDHSCPPDRRQRQAGGAGMFDTLELVGRERVPRGGLTGRWRRLEHDPGRMTP